MSNLLSLKTQIPKGIYATELSRPIIMKGLSTACKNIQQTSKKLISSKMVSKEGELPGRYTGRMRRNIKLHKSRKKDKLWVRVQVDSFKDVPVWYPAVLNYGKRDQSLKPRANPITKASQLRERENISIIEEALANSIKGWGD